MRYKTKVTVLTGEREYRPGTVLPADISSADLAFLKGKGFVEPVDPAPGMWIESDEDEPAEADYDSMKRFRTRLKARRKSGKSARKRRFSIMRHPWGWTWKGITREKA